MKYRMNTITFDDCLFDFYTPESPSPEIPKIDQTGIDPEHASYKATDR
jgi:hypothetical protein